MKNSAHIPQPLTSLARLSLEQASDLDDAETSNSSASHGGGTLLFGEEEPNCWNSTCQAGWIYVAEEDDEDGGVAVVLLGVDALYA